MWRRRRALLREASASEKHFTRCSGVKGSCFLSRHRSDLELRGRTSGNEKAFPPERGADKGAGQSATLMHYMTRSCSSLDLLPTATLPCYSGRKCGITSSVFMYVTFSYTFVTRLAAYLPPRLFRMNNRNGRNGSRVNIIFMRFLRMMRSSVNTSVWAGRVTSSANPCYCVFWPPTQKYPSSFFFFFSHPFYPWTAQVSAIVIFISFAHDLTHVNDRCVSVGIKIQAFQVVCKMMQCTVWDKPDTAFSGRHSRYYPDFYDRQM